MKRDIAAALGVIVFVASFWVQRNYTGLSGRFIDPVMLAVVALVMLFIAMSVMREIRHTRSEMVSPKHIRMVRSFGALLLLVLWVLAFTRLGFMLSTFFGFAALSFLLQTDAVTVRSASLILVIAAVITVLVYFIFNSILEVQLPSGPLIQLLHR